MVEDFIIDVIGSFADGKTTLVKALTNESTLRHSEEKKRGITIRLGYAHFVIFKCNACGKFSRKDKCEYCGSDATPSSRVSIIDSPGHRTLMTIMLSGAALVDGAILVVAANQKFPQAQTAEHLEAIKIIGVKNLVVAQTKVDIVGAEIAKQNKAEIEQFLAKNGFVDIKVIPVFAINDVNVKELMQEIGKFSVADVAKQGQPTMLVVRSFDVNRPGTDINKLHGAIIGGALKSGELRVGDSIIINPGIHAKNGWSPLHTKILSINSEFGREESVRRGVTIGVETALDPALGGRDNMAGSMITSDDNPPIVKDKIAVDYQPLSDKEKAVFRSPIQRNETVLLNVLASKALGTVVNVTGNKVTITVNNGVVPFTSGDRAIISRKFDNVWVLAGSGKIYA